MKKMGFAVGLAAGVLIGYNWPKIKKVAGPAVTNVGNTVSSAFVSGLRGVVQLKENMEDRLAERAAKKQEAVQKEMMQQEDAVSA